MRTAIALGSNLGDREANLHAALTRLAQLGTLTAVSSFHDTAPELFLAQPRFLNAAALLETRHDPHALLHGMLAIESAMGRTRANVPAKGPRLIDLDLLFYGDLQLHTAELTLPHPALSERLFVLAPLAEIAPELRDPRTGQTIHELWASASLRQT